MYFIIIWESGCKGKQVVIHSTPLFVYISYVLLQAMLVYLQRSKGVWKIFVGYPRCCDTMCTSPEKCQNVTENISKRHSWRQERFMESWRSRKAVTVCGQSLYVAVSALCWTQTGWTSKWRSVCRGGNANGSLLWCTRFHWFSSGFVAKCVVLLQVWRTSRYGQCISFASRRLATVFGTRSHIHSV